MIGRREFLATMLAAGSVAACGGGTSEPAASAPPSPAALDWSGLAGTLDGQLVLPSDPSYAAARQLINPRFDRVYPAAISLCRSVADVQRLIAFARAHDVGLAVRSGGHSYGGYSTGSGLVTDVTGLNGVTVDPAAGTATVGAGARLIDVYAQLAEAGVSIPAGTCPTVGIAGLALGGGMGVVGRKYGLTCDVMAAAQVVTADSQIRDCDSQQDPDLFWACRGGGGGNFGVVTAFTFRTHPITDDVSLFELRWAWPAAAAALGAWQFWGPVAPDELFSRFRLQTSSARTAEAQPEVTASGLYLGGQKWLEALLDRFVAEVGAGPTSRSVVRPPSYLHAMLAEAGCEDKTVEQCHLRTQHPQGVLERKRPRRTASDFLVTPLSEDGIATVVGAIERRQADSRLAKGTVTFKSYGGAINRIAADATAFVHRNTLALADYTAEYADGDPRDVVDANAAWLRDFYVAMRPHVSGFAYQNYIDPELANWKQAYYGDNYPRLVRVKAVYDPDNVFRFAQSIPTR